MAGELSNAGCYEIRTAISIANQLSFKISIQLDSDADQMNLLPIPINDGRIALLVDNSISFWYHFPIFIRVLCAQLEQFVKQDLDLELFSFNACVSSKRPLKFCQEFCPLEARNIQLFNDWLQLLQSTCSDNLEEWLFAAIEEFQCTCDLVLFVFYRPIDAKESILRSLDKQKRLHVRLIIVDQEIPVEEKQFFLDLVYLTGGTFSLLELCNQKCSQYANQCVNRMCHYLNLNHATLEYFDELPEHLKRYPWHAHFSGPDKVLKGSLLSKKINQILSVEIINESESHTLAEYQSPVLLSGDSPDY
ncbi:hypothetical protein Ciccas_011110, partial [Cichlidogyrus casuarinus]